MDAEIVVIGDEILLGQIVDTNSAFIAQRLAEEGVAVQRITKIGDEEDVIAETLERASERSQLVVSCGGLGPTHDDRTRFAVARVLGSELETDPAALEEIRNLYAKAGRTMSASNAVQALIPRAASFLSNRVGTAPGLRFTKNRSTVFCIQGVPKEMEWMTREYILPFARSMAGSKVLKYRVIRVTGVPESVLYEELRPVIEAHGETIDVAFLPKLAVGVDIRLTVTGLSFDEAAARIAAAESDFVAVINARFEEAVYGKDHTTMEEVVADLLFRSGKTIVTVESCTGGLIAHRLTNVAGSSRYYLQGFTTYSNESKMRLLGVPASLIETCGAVSAEVAKCLAEKAREISGADIALSTTGIAGPGGGTPSKPVGLVYVGLASKTETHVMKPLVLPYAIDRLTFKERTSQTALDMLRKHLMRGIS